MNINFEVLKNSEIPDGIIRGFAGAIAGHSSIDYDHRDCRLLSDDFVIKSSLVFSKLNCIK
jgi:hypothetical protein